MSVDWIRDKACWAVLVLVSIAFAEFAGADQALIQAVRDQDHETARKLIAAKVDVNEPQGDGATALHWAVHRDDIVITRLLLEAGADANKTNDFGVMPISLAASNRNAAITELLLEGGASANSTLLTGETVLMRAAHSGDLDTIATLIEHGADVNTTEPVRKQTALMWALGENHADAALMLIEAGADIHAKTTKEFTPILFAAREGVYEAAEVLLDAGIDANTRSGKKLSALHIAAQRGHVDVAILLLEHGADANDSEPGYTPLHWAVGTWETELNGANGITSPKGHEWDQMRGVQDGKLEFVKALLKHGADPNIKMKRPPRRFGFTASRPTSGSTPFTLAAFAGEAEIMRLLAANGADMSIRPDNNLTPLMIAAGVNRSARELSVSEEELLDTIKVCVELGADVKDTDRGGNTALHGAAWLRMMKIAQYLIDEGADVNAKNRRGHTPLFVADHSGFNAGGGDKIPRLPIGHMLAEQSVPTSVKKSIDEWSNLPRHVRDAVEVLLAGELESD